MELGQESDGVGWCGSCHLGRGCGCDDRAPLGAASQFSIPCWNWVKIHMVCFVSDRVSLPTPNRWCCSAFFQSGTRSALAVVNCLANCFKCLK